MEYLFIFNTLVMVTTLGCILYRDKLMSKFMFKLYKQYVRAEQSLCKKDEFEEIVERHAKGVKTEIKKEIKKREQNTCKGES